MFFLPQGRYPENFVLISQLEMCAWRGVQEQGVLGGPWGLLTGNLEDRVILDKINDHGRPQGSYSESFVPLSFFWLS